MVEEYKALACLLLYPDDELLGSLDEIEKCLRDSSLIEGPARDALQEFTGQLHTVPLTNLQQDYVSTFDVGKTACLNLFEHLHGDSQDRGAAMVDLLDLYRDHGLELDGQELPDFLPVYLEFLSGLDEEDATALLKSASPLIALIDQQLQALDRPWSAVTGALLTVAGTPRLNGADIPEEELLVPTDADWYDPPVNFASSPDPAGSCGGCPRA